MTLGQIIKNYRQEHGYSMDVFAEKSGISKSYISMLEANKDSRGNVIAPSLKTISLAAKAMNMDFQDVFSQLDSDQAVVINEYHSAPKRQYRIRAVNTRTGEYVEFPNNDTSSATPTTIKEIKDKKVDDDESLAYWSSRVALKMQNNPKFYSLVKTLTYSNDNELSILYDLQKSLKLNRYTPSTKPEQK